MSSSMLLQCDVTQVCSKNSSKNYHNCHNIRFGVNKISSFKSLWKVCLNHMPKDSILVKAYLHLYIQSNGPNSDSSYKIHPLMEEFDINTVCWNNMPKYYEDIYQEFKIRGCGFHKIDITSILKQWINDIIPNYGFVILMSHGHSMSSIISVQGSSLYPSIEIIYEMPCNISPTPPTPPSPIKPVEKIFYMESKDIPTFSPIIDTSLCKNITYIIKNLGVNTVNVSLQLGSTSNCFCCMCESPTLLYPEQTIYLVPYAFAKYGRIGIISKEPNKHSKLKIWYQAQE